MTFAGPTWNHPRAYNALAVAAAQAAAAGTAVTAWSKQSLEETT